MTAICSLNKVQLIGVLENDPVIKYTTSAKPIFHARLLTTEVWENKDGSPGERKAAHHITTAWAKLALSAGDELRAGDLVYVEGQINYKEWDRKDGPKTYTTEINCMVITLLLPANRPAAAAPEGPPPPEEEDLPF